MKRQPSKLEMQVLSVLWERGPSTVREVLESLPDGKTRAYTTVLTVLQVMERKRLVSHTAQGNAHLYRPVANRRQTAGSALHELVCHAFGGNPVSVMQHLLEEHPVSAEELARLKRLIQDHERAERSAVSKGRSEDPR